MKKKIGILAAIVAIIASFVAVPVYAADDPCDYYKGPDKDLICPSSQKTQSDATTTIKNILNTVYLYVGIISTIVIIIGSVFYITAQGDAAKLVKAKSTIIAAVIGLVITLMAFAITTFVTDAIAGNNKQAETSQEKEKTKKKSDSGEKTKSEDE